MFIACIPPISQLSNVLEKYVYVSSEQEVFDYAFLPTAFFINWNIFVVFKNVIFRNRNDFIWTLPVFIRILIVQEKIFEQLLSKLIVF